MQRFYFGAVLCAVLCAAFFSSCSDSDVKISYVKAFTVLDYRSDADMPDARLAVFVETSGGIGRAESIKVKNEETGFEWTSGAPVKFSNADAQWASCLNFVSPNNAMIPSGTYALNFTDAQGKEERTGFSIYYPEHITLTNASDMEKSAAGNYTQFIASYDEKGVMLSYESGTKTASSVFAEHEDAAYCRRCLEFTQGTVYCLLPPVYRDGAQGAAAE
ncbi:MAG: hypothetical protein ACTTKL_02105 [Treponema sp.]